MEKRELNYIKGDLIKLADDGEFDMIIHGCNCFATMAAGIALPIGKKWPLALEVDSITKRGDVKKLGLYTVAHVENRKGGNLLVVNAYTQFHPGRNFKIEYLHRALIRLRIDFPNMRIGIPLIGCGIGGGNWCEVEYLLQTEFRDMDITVVVLPQPVKYKIPKGASY